MMKLWWLAGLVGLTIAVAGCSGDGDDDSFVVLDETAVATSRAATAIAEGFDANVLTAIALQVDDVPVGYTGEGFFDANVYGQINIWYSTSYTNGTSTISSTVARHTDEEELSTAVERVRRLSTGLIRVERNLDVEGADSAFVYGYSQGTASAVLIVKHPYYIQVMVQTDDPAAAAEARDEARTQAFAQVVFDRLQQFLADPDSITPVPGAPPAPDIVAATE